MRHLLFTLYTPLGAWGAASASSATAAYKATELSPSRSALVGLLGAALGWPRPRLEALGHGLSFAVAEDLAPRRLPAPDYHTITPGHPLKGARRWTRFQEVRGSLSGQTQTGSILSSREYFSDGLWRIAVTRRPADADDDLPDLDRLAAALHRPHWPLFAGRKACTLGLPPDPEVIVADTLPQALARYHPPWRRRPALGASLARLRQQCDRQAAQQPRLRLLSDADYPGAPAAERIVAQIDDPRVIEVTSGRFVRRFAERPEHQSWIDRPAPPAADPPDEDAEDHVADPRDL
jgi:CRISPR system Cascade subunit CasD